MKTIAALWMMVVILYSVVYMSHAQDEEATVLPQHITAMINILKADLQSAVQDIKDEVTTLKGHTEVMINELKAHTEDKINEIKDELRNQTDARRIMEQDITRHINEDKAEILLITRNTKKDVATLKHLLDTDECTELSHSCSADAKCTDTMVSFRCKCNEGFTGDGYSCGEVIKNPVYEGRISITDANVLEFATIFETIDPGEVGEVRISGQPSTMPRLKDVLLAIDHKAISVDRLYFYHLFKYPVDNPENNEILPIIGNILNRFEVIEYYGPLIQGWNLKESMGYLYVSLSDYNSLHRFQTQLRNRKRRFSYLIMRVFLPSMEEDRIEDILPLRGDIAQYLYLQIPDVTSPADAAKAGRLLRRLLPVSGDKSFFRIDFPRCQMKDEQLTPLLQSLKGIKVKGWITFPSSSKPSSEEREENLNILAEDATGCKYGINWRSDFDFLW